MQLKWLGTTTVNMQITDTGTLFSGTVTPGQTITITDTVNGITNPLVKINTVNYVTIDTNCGDGFGPGKIFKQIQVVSAEMTTTCGTPKSGCVSFKVPMCPIACGDCCYGYTTFIVLSYTGPSVTVRITDGINVTIFPSQTVTNGQLINLSGTRSDLKFEGDQIKIYVNGVLNQTIDLDCKSLCTRVYGAFTVINSQSTKKGWYSCVNAQCPIGQVADCNGVCGGSSVKDCAGVCYNPCAGQTPPNFVDCGGNCHPAGTPVAKPDCNGVCGGTAVPDCNGVCGGTATVDCNGVCGGKATQDCGGNCRTCNQPMSSFRHRLTCSNDAKSSQTLSPLMILLTVIVIIIVILITYRMLTATDEKQ